MPFNVGPMEVIIVLAIALIVLGPKRIPDAGRALGSGIRNFRRSLSFDASGDAPERSDA
jgi:sec-independent protein translocase protein TatA